MTDEDVIDALAPGSELHLKVKKHLCERLDFSEREMAKFYPRWQAREKQTQAYVDLPNYEKVLKEMNRSGAPPVAVSITIPYIYATINTIVTYMVHAFCGRKPMFAVGGYGAESQTRAPYMETMLQYNVDAKFMIRRFMQYFWDGELYGVTVMKNLWAVDRRKRTVSKKTLMGEVVKVRELYTAYEGNDVENVDPYMFFPDPRVPMADCPTKGEYIFTRDYASVMDLKADEADGVYKHIRGIGRPPPTGNMNGGDSSRSLRAGGNPHPGTSWESRAEGLELQQLDQCTMRIVPAQLFEDEELSKRPELWIFTIANKTQIIQAEPFEYDHGQHPFSITEPHTMGYGFGNLSTADYLSPIQDAASWFLNSHIYNVRSVLNNMLIVNPAMVEMGDLKSPKPGKLIRLKRTAMGQDPRMAVQQLQFHDVTSTHVNDLQGLFRLGDTLSSVTDNLRGIQDAGGRKTATEVRTAGEAGASRLAAQARLYSATGMNPLAMMMAINLQQFLSKEMELTVLGAGKPSIIGAGQLAGNFYFPLHDGTLPQDKVALLDIWKEILMGVMGNQMLAAQYDAGKIFEYVAELGGAKNIENFKTQPMLPASVGVAPPGADLAAGAQAGNLIPLPGARGPGGPAQAGGLPPQIAAMLAAGGM